jgi:hypothetical protein
MSFYCVSISSSTKVVACILTLSACLKSLPWWHLDARLDSTPWLVALEVVLAAWCGSGWQRRGAALVSCLLFLAFSGYTALQWWSGAASCGCFGSLAVPPAATFTLDVLMALWLGWGLWASRHEGWAWLGWRWAARSGGGLAGAVVILALGLLGAKAVFGPVGTATLAGAVVEAGLEEKTQRSAFSTTLATAGAGTATAAKVDASRVSHDQSVPSVTAATLTSSTKPAQDLPAELRTGSWVVVGYRDSCHTCAEEVPALLAQAWSEYQAGKTRRWAFVNYDAAGGAPLVGVLPPTALQLRKPDPWAETPKILKINAGKAEVVPWNR